MVTPAVAILQATMWPSSVSIWNAVGLVLITSGGLISVANTPEVTQRIFRKVFTNLKFPFLSSRNQSRLQVFYSTSLPPFLQLCFK